MAGCFLEKLRWCLIEQVCQGVECKAALCAVPRIGYSAIWELTFMCHPITGLEQCWCGTVQWGHELCDAVEQSGRGGVAAGVCHSDLYPPDVEGAGEQRQRRDVVQHRHRWEVPHQCREHARLRRRRPDAGNNVQVSRTRCHTPGGAGD